MIQAMVLPNELICRHPALAKEWKLRIPVDVVENDEEYVILAQIPGVKLENVSIEVKGEEVHIQVAEAKEEEEVNYILRETAHGDLGRSLVFRSKLDAENSQASLKDGILTLKLPKAKESLPRKIQISNN